MKTPSGLWLIAMLALTACQQSDSDPVPGGVTLGEARALDEAAEMIEQHRLRADHVGDGDDGKGHAERRAGRRIGARRTARPHAAAKHISADDMEMVGVDRLAGTNHARPPAGLARRGMIARDILVAGERVAHQDCVTCCRIKGAPCFVGNLWRYDFAPALEHIRAVRR